MFCIVLTNEFLVRFNNGDDLALRFYAKEQDVHVWRGNFGQLHYLFTEIQEKTSRSLCV